MSNEIIKIFNEYYHLYLNGINYVNNIDLIKSYIQKSLNYIFKDDKKYYLEYKFIDNEFSCEEIRFNDKNICYLYLNKDTNVYNEDDYNLFKIYLGILIHNTNNIKYELEKNIFSEIFNVLHDGMFVCDRDFNILYNNKASEIFIEKILTIKKNNIKTIYDIFSQLNNILKQNEIYKNKLINYKCEKGNINMNYNIIINTILYCDVFYNILIITNNKNICKSHNNSFISHELRNPLQTINFSNHLMQKKNKDESIKKYINISSKAIYDMTKIINDILDMDRIENNKLNLTIENINISDLLDNINFEFNSYITNMNISFKINLDKNVPHTLFTDSTRTKQIIINLLINSLKYTKINKINNILLNVLYNEYLKCIEFNIIDNGIGIKESDIIKILENKEFNINNNSNGFGLYICNKIAILLGGSIKIDNEYKDGAKFVFIHPIKLGDTNIILQKNLENLNINGKILIYDSNSDITSLFDDILINLKSKYNLNNFYINICNKKDNIIDLIEINNYDIIFYDILDINELDFIKIIRRKSYNGKIIIMTSDLSIKINKILFDDILIKPFNENDILEKIKNI